jgi:hypothetical protein
MYYYKEKDIPEIYQMKHRYDSDKDFMDYGEKILDKSLSPFLYYNDFFGNLLNRYKRLVSILFDNVNIVKNFKNYNVHKYYYKQKS